VGVDHLTVGDAETLGAQGFKPKIISARGYRPVDPGFQQLLEGREEDAL
jgi:hypothetical protein